MVLDSSLLNIQHKKLWVKGKWRIQGKELRSSLHLSVAVIEKWTFGSPSTKISKSKIHPPTYIFNPSAQSECNTKSISKWSFADFNSVFYLPNWFLYQGLRVQPAHYLIIAVGRIYGFILFTKCIIAMWNANSPVQDLNSRSQILFLWHHNPLPWYHKRFLLLLLMIIIMIIT